MFTPPASRRPTSRRDRRQTCERDHGAGFEWVYEGAGPRCFAQAMLNDFLASMWYLLSVTVRFCDVVSDSQRLRRPQSEVRSSTSDPPSARTPLSKVMTRIPFRRATVRSCASLTCR